MQPSSHIFLTNVLFFKPVKPVLFFEYRSGLVTRISKAPLA